MTAFIEGITARNEALWLAVPSYIDYIKATHEYDKPIAACFDIDDTIICSERGCAFQNAIEAIQEVKRRGCAVFIISARSNSVRRHTVLELEALGLDYDDYDALYLRDCAEDDYVAAKRVARFAIRDSYSLVLAVGDRPHDLIGVDEDDTEGYYNILMESIMP